MIICKTCNKEHDGTFGSGKYCCKSCANKRVHSPETKEKIKKTLKDKFILQIKYCPICETSFNKKTKTCSKKCANIYQIGKSKKSGLQRKPGSGGLRQKGGLVKDYFEYVNNFNQKMILNRDELIVAQTLDKTSYKWCRNTNGFDYVVNNKHKKYYPDFYIDDLDLYIEYKGYLTKEMIHKMNDSLKRNKFNLLIIYSMDKRLSNLGINLKDFEEKYSQLPEWTKELVSKTRSI
jgi:predicted nuclease of restriction endonuclease-like RecB superfamily